ncbi:MAG: glutathione S-transferase N-terminal domain-containing protein, partial [Brevundimonas sp.]
MVRGVEVRLSGTQADHVPAGAPYELQAIDLRKGEQRTPEYLAINPAGATPALQTAEGVMTQNAAILAYLADLSP